MFRGGPTICTLWVPKVYKNRVKNRPILGRFLTPTNLRRKGVSTVIHPYGVDFQTPNRQFVPRSVDWGLAVHASLTPSASNVPRHRRATRVPRGSVRRQTRRNFPGPACRVCLCGFARRVGCLKWEVLRGQKICRPPNRCSAITCLSAQNESN